MSGRALISGDPFLRILDRAVEGLSAAAVAESAETLGGVLALLSEELDRAAGLHQDSTLEAALEIIPVESLAPDLELDVVPIESLFFDGDDPRGHRFHPVRADLRHALPAGAGA